MYIIEKCSVNVTGNELTKAALVKHDDKSIRGEMCLWADLAGKKQVQSIYDRVDHPR